MPTVPQNEILPEQKNALNDLFLSIQNDPDAKVQKEAGALQLAIKKNDRTEAMTALRVLETSLDRLSAIERHRKQLMEAKLSVGSMLDDIDTHVNNAASTVHPTVIKPVLDAMKKNVPGAGAVISAPEPTAQALQEAYAKLPTALRLPVAGTVIAGGAYLASYPVKWLGKVIGYISTNAGKTLVSLGDTIGVGTPSKARELLRAVAADVPMKNLGMHFHDTYGQALANLYAGLEEGARVIDSAAGGLGGCPYAPGATGNVATEDVVYMLEGMGIATGVDMAQLVAATNGIAEVLGKPPVSRVASALNAKKR